MARENDYYKKCGSGDTYTCQIAEDQSLSVAIIQAIAEFSGQSSVVSTKDNELDPLYHSIDPDALNSLFSTRRGEESPNRKISFVHDGYEVTVKNSNSLTINKKQ